MSTTKTLSVRDKVAQDLKNIPIPTATDLAAYLWKRMAYLEHDTSELERTKQAVNAVGKMTNIFKAQTDAYALARISPSHDNMPFMIPENARPEPITR